MAEKRLYAVLDTNVVVSAAMRADSVPGKVVRAALEGRIVPVYSDEILDEYADVLSRDKFGFPRTLVDRLTGGIETVGTSRAPLDVQEEMPDPDDVVFYAVTLSAREEWDARLVTGNTKHFPVQLFVVTPREMLEILEEREAIE